jgi:hypothetical protein
MPPRNLLHCVRDAQWLASHSGRRQTRFPRRRSPPNLYTEQKKNQGHSSRPRASVCQVLSTELQIEKPSVQGRKLRDSDSSSAIASGCFALAVKSRSLESFRCVSLEGVFQEHSCFPGSRDSSWGISTFQLGHLLLETFKVCPSILVVTRRQASSPIPTKPSSGPASPIVADHRRRNSTNGGPAAVRASEP